MPCSYEIWRKKLSEKSQFFSPKSSQKKRRRKKLKNQGLVASVLAEIITVEKISFRSTEGYGEGCVTTLNVANST